MKPQGIRPIVMHGAKHKPKENGRNIPGWWEDMVQPCKKRDRRQAKEAIEDELKNVD